MQEEPEAQTQGLSPAESVRQALAVNPDVLMALAWFPAPDWAAAMTRWPSFAGDWTGVSHEEYCRRIEGHLKWMNGQGARVRALSPIELDAYIPWCEAQGRDPEDAEACTQYAAEVARKGDAIMWPPGRNDECWCGSGRKYKRCCGQAEAAQLFPPEN
jgi:hypothetical protein